MQAQLPIKQLDVDTWTYQNINSVFHNPEALELSEEEKIDMAKKQKIIKHDNTRISKAPWKTEKQMEQLKKEAEKQEALAAGKVKDLICVILFSLHIYLFYRLVLMEKSWSDQRLHQ